ncbi:hypothetical protein I1A62_07050 [Rhodococcus sp. USK10]|uniref:hypothetical protein n=1 Tax=Rhodococcus sp. USK10 TaxID=2789739 RepID=UPI001C5F9448|nr:hypothetical protein [Rhodococcus sp. USK10]QYB04266.1 hypothetical protein I1A62_07050 [Rhodococcus sp. USK10]
MSKTDGRQSRRAAWWTDMRCVHRAFFVSASVVMVAGVIAVVCADQDLTLDLAAGAGILLSAAGVMAAIVIFARQSKQGEADRLFHEKFMERTEGSLGELKDQLELREQIGAGAAKQLDDEDATTVEFSGTGAEEGVRSQVDAGFGSEGTHSASVGAIEADFPADSLGLETQDGSVIVYDPKDVKLWMIGEVVDFWKRQETTGRWNLSTLKGAAQKKGHSRNSWFLVFENPDSKEFDYYRVSTGGRGKKTPTVTPTPHDDVAAIMYGNNG